MKPTLLQQIVTNLSILTAVMLSLHSFIANLTAGRFGVEVRESTNEISNASGGKSRHPTNNSRAGSRAHHGSHANFSHGKQLRVRKAGEAGSGPRPDKEKKSDAWAQHEEANVWEDSDGRSAGSQENITKRTVTWQVSSNVTTGSSMLGGEEELQTLPPDGELREARARNFLT